MPSSPAIRDATGMADSLAATLTRASAAFGFVAGDDAGEDVSFNVRFSRAVRRTGGRG